MGNCLGNLVGTLRKSKSLSPSGSLDELETMTRRVPDNISDDYEYDNLMMHEETIEAAQRKYKTQLEQLTKSERRRTYENKELLSSSKNFAYSQTSNNQTQIVDPSLLASTMTNDSNYYSWISDAIDDSPFETQQCEIFVTTGKNKHAGPSASNVLAKFKNWRRSAYYSQLSTPSSDVELEWEPDAAILPFLSADLKSEYLKNFNANQNNVDNSSNRSSPVRFRKASESTPNGGVLGTPKSCRSNSPALEWDPDDVLDHETLQLLTDIDRIVAQCGEQSTTNSNTKQM